MPPFYDAASRRIGHQFQADERCSNSFRKASKSWFIKILFGILIVSFSVWGIGDVIRQRAEMQPAIVIGKEQITASQVVDEFRRDTERLSAAFGGKLTTEQARQFGLLQRTVEHIVTRGLLDQSANDLGLGADENTLRQLIASNPAFQNQLHVFDKAQYQRALVRAGLSERQFVAMERRDIAREQLMQAVAEGVTGAGDPHRPPLPVSPGKARRRNYPVFRR